MSCSMSSSSFVIYCYYNDYHYCHTHCLYHLLMQSCGGSGANPSRHRTRAIIIIMRSSNMCMLTLVYKVQQSHMPSPTIQHQIVCLSSEGKIY